MENEKLEGFDDWFLVRIIYNDRVFANIVKIFYIWIKVVFIIERYEFCDLGGRFAEFGFVCVVINVNRRGSLELIGGKVWYFYFMVVYWN